MSGPVTEQVDAVRARIAEWAGQFEAQNGQPVRFISGFGATWRYPEDLDDYLDALRIRIGAGLS